MKNDHWLDQLSSAIAEIKSEFWAQNPMRTFYFHPYYRVGVTKESIKYLKHVFGDSFWGRFKNQKKNLRKFDWLGSGFSRVNLPVPSDSIVFYQPKRQRLIIVSKSQNAVLKISNSTDQLSLFDGEVGFMNRLGASSFSPYIAKILDHGNSKLAARWIISEFRGNSHSLKNEDSPAQYLLTHLEPLVLKPLTEFYKTFDIEKISLNEWLNDASTRINGHWNENELSKFIQNLQAESVKYPGYFVIMGQIHFDLHAGNLLREGNKITFIDWEVSTEALLLIDIVDFYRRYPHDKNKFFQTYQKWMSEEFNIKVPADSFDLLLKIYSLERTLIYFERWKENRLSDRHGFEYKIIFKK